MKLIAVDELPKSKKMYQCEYLGTYIDIFRNSDTKIVRLEYNDFEFQNQSSALSNAQKYIKRNNLGMEAKIINNAIYLIKTIH